MANIGTVNADRSVFNIAGGDQANYHIYPPPAAELDNLTHYPVFNAPVDILSVHFTGRGNELVFLQTALSRSHSGVPSRCAVYGMPGIGKTQLLLRYAKSSWDQHLYSCIIWISATSVDKITEGISGILDLIEHPDRYLRDQTAKLTAAKLWLEKYEGGDWLLVFDNVQRETLGFLRDHLPLTIERGNILFSTRTADVAESLANAAGEQHQLLGLHAMKLQDTANLLFADAGIDAEIVTPSLFSQAEDLVKRVGLLPLAVVQAASFMKQTHTTLDDMLELYRSERKIEAIRWENDLSSYEERSVARTILNQLSDLNQQSHNIGNLLKLLSLLDPENIPVGMLVDGAEAWLRRRPEKVPSRPKRTILRKIKEWRAQKIGHTKSDADDITTTSHSSPEFDTLIDLIVSPIEFQTAIQKLQSLSLVERRSHNGKSSLWIHDLIQFVVREHARKDETYQEWLQSSWSLVHDVFLLIEDPTLPQWWADCEKFVPHLQSLRDAWNDLRGTNLEMTRANMKIARYFERRGRYDEAEVLSKQVLDETEKYLGNDHLDTILSMNILANVYMSQGRDEEAEALFKRALEGRENHLRSDHPDTLKSVNNLANVYSWQGRFNEAEPLLKRALEGLGKYFGTGHPNTLKLVSNLAVVYSSQGRHGDAEVLQKQALDSREKHLGTDHPDTLMSANNLAMGYLLQERCEESELLLRRALEGRVKNLGIDNPDTLVSVNNLARVYLLQGRHEDSEALYKQALEGREKHVGADHPDTFESMNGLADVYSSQGRYCEAEKLLERALEGREKHFGTDHPDTLESANSFANYYSLQGRYDEAEKVLIRALEGGEKHLWTDHPNTLISVNKLADVYSSQGRHDEAEVLKKRALEAREERLWNNVAEVHSQ